MRRIQRFTQFDFLLEMRHTDQVELCQSSICTNANRKCYALSDYFLTVVREFFYLLAFVVSANAQLL